MAIKTIKGRMIYDSRGNPTTEVELTTENGIFVSSCPSGASTGASEACELRDKEHAHHGKGVLTALKNINEVIAPALIGKDEKSQVAIDKAMLDLDGTENKTKLGANAILPVSMAVCRAGAKASNLPLHAYIKELFAFDEASSTLPIPCFNIINGGEHAGNEICVQEFMISPIGASSFREAMQMASETYQELRLLLKKKFGIASVNVGDEGGFAPLFETESAESNKKSKSEFAGLESIFTALDLICEAIDKAGYKDRIKIGMDAAASSFFKTGKYNVDYKGKAETFLTSDEMVNFYKTMVQKYPIVFIEDPLDEEDWEGFTKATKTLNLPIIGDDLLTTNPKRIQKAVDKKACNALLLKLNQIGSVTESMAAVKLAKQNGWKVMTSHRSGETTDDFIADLAVGLSTDLIKSGAPCRGERLAKYNRLMKIEEDLGEDGKLHAF